MNKEKSILGGSQAWFIWIIANLIVIFGFNMQTGYAIVNNMISSELQLTVAQMATIAAVYTWIFALSQLFSGSILDVLGLRKVFPVAVALITVGAYFFATAHSFSGLLISQIFLAMGASFGFVGAGFTGGLWFGFAKFGIMFGLTQTVASLASQAGQMIYTTSLAGGVHWRTLIWGMIIFGLIILALVVFFVRDPVLSDSTEKRPSLTIGGFFTRVFTSLRDVLKIKIIWLAAIQGGITFGAFLGIAVFWGPKLLEAHGLTFSLAGNLAALLWLGLALFSPVCNTWSNSMKKRKPVLFVFAIVQAVMVLALMYGGSSPVLLGIIVFLYGAGAAGHMLNFTVGGESVPQHLIGTSAAVVNGMMFIIGGITIGLPSKLLVTQGTMPTLAELNSALWIYPALIIFAALITFVMKESYKA